MFAIIDIETTGGSAVHEKITEIAIYLHDGKEITGEYSTLINPEKRIPPFIERLTGISDELVQDSPKFYEVAREIVEMTQGCVFVAHNVLFDYGFIQQEFMRLGYRYFRPTLCTVKLSRRLLPGFKSYSLGNLCASLDIRIENRHRAAGDALATVKVFEKLLEADPTLNGVDPKGLNPALDKGIFTGIPNVAGVYYFHDENGKIIYIGKSRDLHARVLSHFSNKRSPKAQRMCEQVTDISYEETGSELIALLMESDEIKKHLPVYNRMLRRTMYRYGLTSFVSQSGYLNLQLSRITKDGMPQAVFSSYEEASSTLFELVRKFNLCQKLSGLYQGNGACFHHSIGQCDGACIGLEQPEIYNERVKAALASFENPWQNMLIIDKGRYEEEGSAVLIENGKYIGFGWFDKTDSDINASRIRECIKPYCDNRDVQQILRQYARNRRGLKFIRF